MNGGSVRRCPSEGSDEATEEVSHLNWDIRPQRDFSTAVEDVTERVEVPGAFTALIGDASA
jgi:hypothetical protein